MSNRPSFNIRHNFVVQGVSVERDSNGNAVDQGATASFVNLCDAIDFAEAKSESRPTYSWYVWELKRDCVVKTFYGALPLAA